MTSLKERYGGSDRRHHLKLNRDVTKELRAGCYMASALFCGIVATLGDPMGGLYLAANAAVVTPIACQLQEKWATPDRDYEENRKGLITYWKPYGLAVKHRAVYSHSALGTVLRLLYGFPFLPALLFLPRQLGMPILFCWIMGAIVSDFAHMRLDDFAWYECIVGVHKRKHYQRRTSR